MEENKIFEIVFILDRSGSMGSIREDTIGTFNSLLAEYREAPEKILVSVVLFNSETTPLFTRAAISEVPELTKKDYMPYGSTALCDAAGRTITAVLSRQAADAPEDKPDKTLLFIMTDGLENASRNYTGDGIRALVETTKTANHWEYSFYGANFDAVEVGRSYGFSADESASFCADRAGMVKFKKLASEKMKDFLN